MTRGRFNLGRRAMQVLIVGAFAIVAINAVRFAAPRAHALLAMVSP